MKPFSRPLVAILNWLAMFTTMDAIADDGCDLPPAIAEPSCESARILKVRTVGLAESGVDGPTPPTEEGTTLSDRPPARAIHYISLDCGGKIYVARVRGGTPGFDPQKLAAAEALDLRVEDGKAFLKSEQGTEFEAVLAAVQSSDTSPPK